jgi:hypothetical protein
VTIGGGAGIGYILLMGARARRLAFLEHLRKIAELNHNVRNALTVIQSAQYVRKTLLKAIANLSWIAWHVSTKRSGICFPLLGNARRTLDKPHIEMLMSIP